VSVGRGMGLVDNVLLTETLQSLRGRREKEAKKRAGKKKELPKS
jgi:hypothetical protein